jgi:hypothetical protein
LGDGRAIDQFAAMAQRAVGQRMVLEHGLDRLQVELGVQVHDGHVFVVEVLVLVDAVAVAFDEMPEQFGAPSCGGRGSWS